MGGCDEINHSDFVNFFGPAMGIGHLEPSHKKQVELPGERDLEREVNEIMKIMEDHMLKFSHPREALRSLDLSHDGWITRNEMRAFFQRFGLEHESADHVFNLLRSNGGSDDQQTCRYHDFMKLFDPVMQPALPGGWSCSRTLKLLGCLEDERHGIRFPPFAWNEYLSSPETQGARHASLAVQ